MTTEVRLTDDDGNTETLTVSRVERYCHDLQEPVEEGWDITGIQPDDSDLLGSDLSWISGSMASYPEERYYDGGDGDPKFPAVYVPDEYGVMVDPAGEIDDS